MNKSRTLVSWNTSDRLLHFNWYSNSWLLPMSVLCNLDRRLQDHSRKNHSLAGQRLRRLRVTVDSRSPPTKFMVIKHGTTWSFCTGQAFDQCMGVMEWKLTIRIPLHADNSFLGSAVHWFHLLLFCHGMPTQCLCYRENLKKSRLRLLRLGRFLGVVALHPLGPDDQKGQVLLCLPLSVSCVSNLTEDV